MTECLDNTAVLLHGYKAGTPDYEHVMWGNLEKREFGRLTKGIQIALRERAVLMYWGGGEDAEANHTFALERLTTLKGHFGNTVSDLLRHRSHLGKGGSTTSQEVCETLRLCVSRGIGRLILVSDNSHIDRCFRVARQQMKSLGLEETLRLEARQSDTSFSEQETVLFEPETSYRKNLRDVAARVLQLDSMLGGKVDRARVVLHRAIDTLMRDAR